VALGLISDLYPMADEIQHGNLAQLGGLFSTFITATPSDLQINLDAHEDIDTTAHMLVISNMPYFGPHFQISPDVSFRDGHLDVFTFSDMGKLNMISYAMLSRGGIVEDAGILHYRARKVKIVSNPQMPVIADGVPMSQGSLSIHIHPRALKVMAGAELTGRPAPTDVTIVTIPELAAVE